ncbi:DUF4279 domain-containing protein [Flavobacterium sp. RHBU_24]|uniref:DUF4279 domain-containing protein n=1 Tax=Flavobacterium sp. RHBU_24 TaxID=3391185 RepID=UPI0039854FBA
MKDTTGYIYLAIKTENKSIDLEWFNSHLTIKPTTFSKMFEKGKIPVCTSWEYSSGNFTNPFYADEIAKLISKLSNHTSEFLKLKSENPEFHFVFEVVMYLGDETPGLSFDKQTLQFLNTIGAEIDCDIYNSK